MPTALPLAANLDQLRKQAKDLLRGQRAGQPRALARFADSGLRLGTPIRLADAQLVLAREYGFASWPKLRAYLLRVQANGPTLQHAYQADLGYYADRAAGLLASAQDGTEPAVRTFAHWQAPLTKQGARAVVAREHGFSSWPALRAHVTGLAGSGEPFARAYQAIEAKDLDALAGLLDRFPDLVHALGTNRNDLLGLALGTRDERLVELVIRRGADVTRANAHGSTPLHNAGRPDLTRLLLAAGAPVEGSARGDGGTPLAFALFWGSRETAELLAEHGILPANLRIAAGLGKLDLIDALLAADGTLSDAAGAHRAFYRPHSGFPAWRPGNDPQQIRDEALTWAARNNRVAAIERLVARGADPCADVYRGTALTWAAFTGSTAAARRLVELGADPDQQATFGGPEHGKGVTALHLAAQNGRTETVRALLALGADPSIRDDLYHGDARGWALNGEHAELAEELRARIDF